MKKIFLKIFAITIIGFALTSTVHAISSIDGARIDPNQDVAISRVNGQIQVVIKGTLTPRGMEDYATGPDALELFYTQITDLNKTRDMHNYGNYTNCSGYRTKQVPPDPSFTCTIRDVGYGSYIFQMGYSGWSGMTLYSNDILQFNVTGGEDVNGPENIADISHTVVGNTIVVKGTMPDIENSKTTIVNCYLSVRRVQGLWSDPIQIADPAVAFPIYPAKGKTAFSVSTPALPSGSYVSYVRCAVLSVNDSGGKPVGQSFTTFLRDSVGDGSQSQYALTDPVSTGGNLVGVNGYWADPQVTVSGPDSGIYNLILGYATLVQGSSTSFSCALDPANLLGPAVTIASGTAQATINNVNKFTNLKPSLYCVGVQYSLPNSTTANIPTQTTPTIQAIVNPPNGRYFLKIFSVGGVPIPPGATLDQGANGNGCTTTDNKSYCLLAPLPGIGDPTGKLDVTQGIGSYFNMLIRLFFGIIGVLSVLMIVIGGIEYMSTVSLGEKEGAKERITSALMGLMLALSAYIILRTINPNLVNITVTVPAVSIATDVDTFTPNSKTYSNPAPRTLSANVSTYDAQLSAAAKANGFECTLAKAFMLYESSGNRTAMSTFTQNGVVGHAYGLMQLIPSTYADLGGVGDVTNFNDPNYDTNNINAGVAYLKDLSSSACSVNPHHSCVATSLKSMAAAYNGGPKANAVSDRCAAATPSVDTTAFECQMNPGYAQTRAYVVGVQNFYDTLKKNSGWGCS